MAGFVSGVLPVAYLPVLPGRIAIILVLVLFTCCALSLARYCPSLCSRRSKATGVVVGALSGLVLGLSYAALSGHALLDRRLPEDCVRTPAQIEGVVGSLPVTRHLDEGVRRQRFELRVIYQQPTHCVGPRTVLMSYYGDAVVQPGERWRFSARLRRPWGLANPGSHNLQGWFAQTGVDAVASASHGERLAPAGPLDGMHHRWRMRISAEIEKLPLSTGARAVLKALVVADKSGIDQNLWQLFQLFGVNHLLVVSGLHIGLVGGLGLFLGGLVTRLVGPRAIYAPAVAALGLACAYAALAGFTLPTQRALCMLVAPLFALLLGRRSATARSLLVAAVVVLAVNPLAGLGSGFWLSFGAVAALLWIASWQSGGSGLLGFARMHLYMSLFMVPLGAWFFGGVSLVSAPANMLMIPLVGFYVVPLALAGAAVSLLGLPVDATLWWLAAQPLEVVLAGAQLLSEPDSALLYHRRSAGWIALLLAVVAVGLLISGAPWRLRLAGVALLAPLWLSGPGGPADAHDAQPESLQVSVLDVGQGTSVVIRAGARTLVYDTGGGDPQGSNIANQVLLPYLEQLGVTSLDTLIVSHGDLDHAAGMTTLIGRFAIGRVRTGHSTQMPGAGRRCRAGEAWRWSEAITFQLLSPAPAETLASNDQSCVLRVTVGDYHLLLPGDVERDRERVLASYWPSAVASDWLLVGHHGSRTSSTWPLLKAVRPSRAIVSSGYANRFGHPHPLVVARLQSFGARVHNTADAGALEFVIGTEGLTGLRSYREKCHRYWM